MARAFNPNLKSVFIFDVDYTILDNTRINDHIREVRVPLFLPVNNAKALYDRALLKARSANSKGKVAWANKPHTDVRDITHEMARLYGDPNIEFMLFHNLFADIHFEDFLREGTLELFNALSSRGHKLIIKTEGNEDYQYQKINRMGILQAADFYGLITLRDKKDPKHLSIDLRSDGIKLNLAGFDQVVVIDDKPAIIAEYNKRVSSWVYVLMTNGHYASDAAPLKGVEGVYRYVSPRAIHMAWFPQDFVASSAHNTPTACKEALLLKKI